MNSHVEQVLAKSLCGVAPENAQVPAIISSSSSHHHLIIITSSSPPYNMTSARCADPEFGYPEEPPWDPENAQLHNTHADPIM